MSPGALSRYVVPSVNTSNDVLTTQNLSCYTWVKDTINERIDTTRSFSLRIRRVDMGQVSVVAAALQKQAARDFGSIWEITGTVDAFETPDAVPVDYWPVIIRDNIDQPGAAGFHQDEQGRPFSLVQVDANWSLTASHETLSQEDP